MMSEAYQNYMLHVNTALKRGFPLDDILAELKRESLTIDPRAQMKAAELAMEKTPYKRREAIRAALECKAAIDRIVRELQDKKEIPV